MFSSYSFDFVSLAQTALLSAAEHGHEVVVDILMHSDVDLSVAYSQALQVAALRGHDVIVGLILNVKLPRNVLNRAFESAVASGRTSVVARMLRDERIYSRYGTAHAHVASAPVLNFPKARNALRSARRQLWAERKSTLIICLLLRRASWPLWSSLRHRIMLFSHGEYLEGSSDEAKMDDLRNLLKRVDFSLMMAGAPSIGSTTAGMASLSMSAGTRSRHESSSSLPDDAFSSRGHSRSRRRSSYQIMLE